MIAAKRQLTIDRLQRQLTALVGFSSYAFHEADLSDILQRAAQDCAAGLEAAFCKIFEYRPSENDLRVIAGYGLDETVIGRMVSVADRTSPQGRVYVSGEPIIIPDIAKCTGYQLPEFYHQHNVVSTLGVAIRGQNSRYYGVLRIDSQQPQAYDEHDVAFLTGFANVLAEVIITKQHNEQIKAMLTEKQVFADELKHRVRNNLQLINGMLLAHLRAKTSGVEERLSIAAINRRILALSEVYEQLLGTGLGGTIDFADYLTSLCLTLPGLQGSEHEAFKIVLNCAENPPLIGPDMVTSLGMIVAELVSNSFEHANRTAIPLNITIALHRSHDGGTGVLEVGDNGPGFVEQPGSRRHGVGLVRRLTQQIKGHAELGTSNGTAWTIHFPISVEPILASA